MIVLLCDGPCSPSLVRCARPIFLVDRGRPQRRADLSSLGFVAAMTMLVVYHRAYDACALIFALAWAISTLADTSEPRQVRGLAAAACVCLAAFLTPGGSMLVVLHQWGWLPDQLAASAAWQTFVVPFASWALVDAGAHPHSGEGLRPTARHPFGRSRQRTTPQRANPVTPPVARSDPHTRASMRR